MEERNTYYSSSARRVASPHGGGITVRLSKLTSRSGIPAIEAVILDAIGRHKKQNARLFARQAGKEK